REHARAAGAVVVELDLSVPFTAARARNAGFERMQELHGDLEWVQFVDADCVLRAGWLEAALCVLRARADVAVVCGRRREIAPETSVFNRLCDREWDTPIGETRSCGGDALVRSAALRLVGGYDSAMIAGEEADLCLRLARRGFRILRLDVEMTAHDAAMSRWGQWWRRALRTGHTTAELLAKHGPAPEHRRLRRAASTLGWAVAVPFASAAVAAWALLFAHPVVLALALLLPLLAYALLFLRVHVRERRAGRAGADARAYAASCVLSKWPEACGMWLYVARRGAGRRARWIEYKDGPRGIGAPERST
ncbi:MAG: glycosyltransferase, partial [Planctomycetota bacterium]